MKSFAQSRGVPVADGLAVVGQIERLRPPSLPVCALLPAVESGRGGGGWFSGRKGLLVQVGGGSEVRQDGGV